ncbi:hypothetical protein J6590_080546 [Homalodisca vitripennis]|nr:hypothetical protein J6590_080546 [Homalodisca vitripennis]
MEDLFNVVDEKIRKDHPPYSPDLVLREFHLFHYLKEFLGGKRFNTDDELPPFYSDLIPIEIIWTGVKNHVASRNTTFTLQDVKKLQEKSKWENFNKKELKMNVGPKSDQSVKLKKLLR